MRYLGIDVHVATTVFCVLDTNGELVDKGSIPTTTMALQALAQRLLQTGEIVVGQEVGKMCYFVHDALTTVGVKVKSFNAHQLRMIASSRKKTDRKDAYWIAKALQTGMTPPEVYVPTGEVRRLRSLLSRRIGVMNERKRWLVRARAYLQAAGYRLPNATRSITRMELLAVADRQGADAHLMDSLALCKRMEQCLNTELKLVDETIREAIKGVEAIQRLKTIPSVGDVVAATIYAWVGDVSRFASARLLASYAGLVPSVRQSGSTLQLGSITKAGSPQLRAVLVQAGHVLLFRCASEESLPLKMIAQRVHTSRQRRKIAVVAAARHILRIAYYVLRDNSAYDPNKINAANAQEAAAA